LIGAQDIVYVGGGNTANMLSVWRLHGLDEALRAAWQNGTVLAGVSAGALCWFDEGVTDSFGRLDPLACLGFLKGSCCPHYDGDAERRPRYQELVRQGMAEGFAIEDGAAVHFVNDRVEFVVRSRIGAKAYRVDREGAEIVEQELSPATAHCP
jgi:peptidase E